MTDRFRWPLPDDLTGVGLAGHADTLRSPATWQDDPRGTLKWQSETAGVTVRAEVVVGRDDVGWAVEVHPVDPRDVYPTFADNGTAKTVASAVAQAAWRISGGDPERVRDAVGNIVRHGTAEHIDNYTPHDGATAGLSWADGVLDVTVSYEHFDRFRWQVDLGNGHSEGGPAGSAADGAEKAAEHLASGALLGVCETVAGVGGVGVRVGGPAAQVPADPFARVVPDGGHDFVGMPRLEVEGGLVDVGVIVEADANRPGKCVAHVIDVRVARGRPGREHLAAWRFDVADGDVVRSGPAEFVGPARGRLVVPFVSLPARVRRRMLGELLSLPAVAPEALVSAVVGRLRDGQDTKAARAWAELERRVDTETARESLARAAAAAGWRDFDPWVVEARLVDALDRPAG